jgi:antitoxin HigA-1
MEPRQLSVSAFAKELEISRKHLSEIINGHQRITPNIAVRLAHRLGTTPTLWLNLQNGVDIWDAEKEFADRQSAA